MIFYNCLFAYVYFAQKIYIRQNAEEDMPWCWHGHGSPNGVVVLEAAEAIDAA